MNRQPYFSILMCVYNKTELLEYAINSVLTQSETSFELLILDNSDYNREITWNILQAQQQKDNRIKLFRNQQNQGWAKGASDLLKKSNGKYMTFLAADDFLMPGALEEVREAAEKEKADIVWIGNKFYQFDQGILQESEESVPSKRSVYDRCHASNIAEIMRSVFYNSFFHYERIEFLKEKGIDFFDSHYGDCAGMTHALANADKMVVLDKALYGLTVNTSQSRGTFYIDGEQYIFAPQWKSIAEACIRDNYFSSEDLHYCAVTILKNHMGNIKSMVQNGTCVNKYMQPQNMDAAARQKQIRQVMENETIREMALFYGKNEFEQEMREITMNRRLIFFVGVYDTLDLFTYELCREFQDRGYETMIFDVREMERGLSQLAQFIRQPVKAMITFNNLGFNMELKKGKNMWEELQIPCINILMDHPFCYKSALDAAPANAVVLCTDKNHMKYVQRFYPEIATVGYFPHAGKETAGEKKPIAERTVDVLYAGNLSKSFAENIMPDFSRYTEFDAKKVCEKAYSELIQNPWKTTEQALEESLQSFGIQLKDEELKDVIADLHVVDLYAVSYYREKTVRVLAESGISVHLYGAGWEKCEWITRPNVFYGGKIPAEEVVKKMQDAKIVLSTMTWFKDGTHDRVFNGILQGAVAASDTSVYMKEEFCGFQKENQEEQRELVLFELTELEKLPQQIRELLCKPDVMQQIAERGYQKVKENHTWKVRAKELEEDLFPYL